MATACQVSAFPPAGIAPERCPLCGGVNDCQLCTISAYKGSCWCMNAQIPDELLATVPAESRNRACICRGCVERFHQTNKITNAEAKIRPGDYYFDKGLMVLTATYLARRGYCCGNGCRHCPYRLSDTTR